MNKTMLREKAKLSSGTIAKLGKNENVTTDVLLILLKIGKYYTKYQVSTVFSHHMLQTR